MLIDVKSISASKGASMTVETEIDPDELVFSALEYQLTRPLVFQGLLQNTGNRILALTGRIRTSFAGECARCLMPVECSLDLPLTEAFRPAKSAEAPDDEDSYEYAGLQLDIGQAIRDNLVLALPQRLFCREDCLGLCPDCGASLNERDCGCAAGRKSQALPFDQLEQLL
jgi:uncharacterized protein